MNRPETTPYIDRDLSWLAFNHRVLREAADPDVPLFDRLGFLAIFSSNLDEFFRVRVGALRTRVRSGEGGREAAREAAALLQRIRERTVAQQEEFGALLRHEILPGLAAEGIELVDDGEVPESARSELDRIYRERVLPELRPAQLTADSAPFLRNRGIYLVAALLPREGVQGPRYGLVEIPTGRVPRFVSVSTPDHPQLVLFVDDLIRLHLHELFPDERFGATHSVKLSRDAELYVEEELTAARSEAIVDRRFLRSPRGGHRARRVMALIDHAE